MRRALLAALAAATAASFAGSAHAAFPFAPQNDPGQPKYRLPSSAPVPSDLDGKRVWMYASTPPSQPSPLTADARELNGVRGAWVVDANRSAPQAWETTTGRPDVTIAVLDSGVQWNDWDKPMKDVRLNTRISRGETPAPGADRLTPTDGSVPCATFATRAGRPDRDLNGDGVFNVVDYACDSRVDIDPPNGVGPRPNDQPILDPQDVLIAFTDGDDDDGNGYADDIVGWDYVDDDNDPFDDVQYGHGSGEAMDSGGEANNGGDLGTCPNCTLIHMRVGTSFVADVNAFALATIYAADNDVEVVQEALGTLNKSRLGLDAVKYAYDHGVTVIKSAADEAAQHHNWPSSYPHGIVVNSATHTGSDQSSFLMFNGCTNFSSRITLAIPSVSCSSDATGRAAGMAGLLYAAAFNARDAGQLDSHPACRRTNGAGCALSANEVRQIMASGTFGTQRAADDVNFAQTPAGQESEPACGGQPVPGCTDPFFALTGVAVPRVSVAESYPARKGHDQFYGYGRVNMNRAVKNVHPGAHTASGDDDEPARVPPEAELETPEWYQMVDPAKQSLSVEGYVWARGREYTCRLYVAPGAYPKDTAAPNGDFVAIPYGACNGQPRSTPVSGEIANVAMADIKALFSQAAVGSFNGPETGLGPAGAPNPGNNVGRPNKEPYSFVVKVVATTTGASPLSGDDRRQAYLHRDQDMLDGFPMHLAGDVEASPVLADLDGDNRRELIVANSDGVIDVMRRDGSSLPGWPRRTGALPYHPASRAFASGAVAPAYNAVLTTPAVGDLDHDGTLEVVVADLGGYVSVFDGESGELEGRWRTRRQYSGAPLEPFENVRGVNQDGQYEPALGNLHRMQFGFIASPVLADVDRDDGGKLEIVAASMDRHVYVWNGDGTDVPGWPLVVVDPGKLRDDEQFHPITHAAYFDIPGKTEGGEKHEQGAIIATPAVGQLEGGPDSPPEIVVGTNENYWVNEGDEGPLNAGGINQAAYAPLGTQLPQANGRLYALRAAGDADGVPDKGAPPWLPGWPFKVGILYAGILPMVGEGITGAPIMGNVPCQGPAAAPRVGVLPAAGVAYVVNANGQSCFGRDPDGKDIGLNTEGGAGSDQPLLPAVGHPAFGDLGSGISFLAPAAGVQRAADVALPEYQGGQDYLVAWELTEPQGTIKQGWPVQMNDLQFLTGPSIADLSPAPGQEVVAGSAHHDLRGYNSAGAVMGPEWPKLTGDWSVANPTIGTFGVLDTDASARKVVVHGTRNGRLLAYSTEGAACGAASWPRFHHDLANSGDLRRDAEPPGTPMGAKYENGTFSWTAPGDDVLCGTASAYELVTSDAPITPANFAAATPIADPPAPKAPGQAHDFIVPSTAKRYVAVRARDEQGNVGRPAAVDTAPPVQGGTGRPSETTPTDGGSGQPGDGSSQPGGGPATGTAPDQSVAPGSARSRCMAARLRVGALGIGRLRLGHDSRLVLKRVGPPRTASRRGDVWNWCVRGGGRVSAVFVNGRIRLIMSTAPRHEAAGAAGPRDRVTKLRRVYPGSPRFGSGVWFTHRSSRVVFRVRRARVMAVGVADRRGVKDPRLLRAYLRRARV